MQVGYTQVRELAMMTTYHINFRPPLEVGDALRVSLQVQLTLDDKHPDLISGAIDRENQFVQLAEALSVDALAAAPL